MARSTIAKIGCIREFWKQNCNDKSSNKRIRKGLDESGVKLLWVLKAKIVDKEEGEGLEEMVGDSFIKRTKHTGLVIKGWVDQKEILSHPVIGVVEAARLGVWDKSRGWVGERLVKGEEIAKMVKMVMCDENLRGNESKILMVIEVVYEFEAGYANKRYEANRLVSQKKRRMLVGGYDLDMSYITPRILAMSFPAEQMKAIYRNPMWQVKDVLEMRHKGHYKVCNLCIKEEYDPSHFNNLVERFPFDDNHVPSLQMIKELCESVHSWLSSDPKNTVVIHCMVKLQTLHVCFFPLFH
ncbi:phosphatidylinositol 3,4,5-trisphosphate 3-phosphatase and protein-tyrosine-phosphatase PTEN1 isoform X2 [Tanacetum coccineum]